MDIDEKKLWQRISVTGFVFMLLCVAVSIFQFYTERRFETSFFKQFLSIGINFFGFCLFFLLMLNPLHFSLYGFVFYVYGIGNFFDNGNILGAICICTAIVFFYFAGFTKRHKVLKYILLSVLPLISLITQAFHAGLLQFILSVMHILGTVFMFFLVYHLVAPRIKEALTIEYEKHLDSAVFSEQDLEFITAVLAGEKYRTIAALNNTSVSSVKVRMLELYRLLGAKNKVEFVTLYSNCVFKLV